MAWVTLQSNDLERFVIEAEVAKKSILIKNLLDDLPEDDEEIPIPLVNAAILKKVLLWMQQHKVKLQRLLHLTNSIPGRPGPGLF